MKAGTTELLKFKKLVRVLGESTRSVVGVLELLWQGTAKNAPAGDIGRHTNDEIAILCDWQESPRKLVDALIETGWIDTCETHRLVVHDWSMHAPNYIKGNLQRWGKEFAKEVTKEVTGVVNEPPREVTKEVTKEAPCEVGPPPKKSTTIPSLIPSQALPSQAAAAQHTPEKSNFDLFWDAVHCKTAKRAAEGAYEKAIKRLVMGGNVDPHGYLLERMILFALSPVAKPPGRSPIHPSTWLNQDRFADDEAEWQNTGGAKPADDPLGNLELRERLLARGVYQ